MGDVYVGRSLDASIYKNDHDSIKCNDPKFDEYICMKQTDFEDMVVKLLEKGAK